MRATQFRDRRDAGRQLAARLVRTDLEQPVVLALPRGGVPVAYEVAVAFGVSLEVFIARKIGAPGQQEYGIAAIAEGLDGFVRSAPEFGITDDDIARFADRERRTLLEQVDRYRPDRDLPPMEGRDVLVVDDGLATGITAEAALTALRRHRPRRLILAVPVGSPDTAARLKEVADEVVCLCEPADLGAVGLWYANFGQTSDREVRTLLSASRN